MKWKLYISLFGLLCGSFWSYSQYNAFAVDQLSDLEMVQLASVVPPGTVIRLGGEEYEHKDYSVSRVLSFVDLIDGKVSYMAGDFDPVGKYQDFGSYALNEITYGNEQWLELEDWGWVRRDFWTYLFNREKYYRKHADRHLKVALAYLSTIVKTVNPNASVVINVPLPQNKFLSAYLDQVAKNQLIEKVSIHVYGKWLEGDYFDKLNSWLAQINSYGFEVMAGEMSGLFNHAEGRELKNSELHRNMHMTIMDLFDAHGISEVYYFTLVAPGVHKQWSNPMIYHRWEVGDDYALDTEENVFR